MRLTSLYFVMLSEHSDSNADGICSARYQFEATQTPSFVNSERFDFKFVVFYLMYLSRIREEAGSLTLVWYIRYFQYSRPMISSHYPTLH